MRNLSLLVLTIILFTSCGNENSNNKGGATDSIKKESAPKYVKRVQNLEIIPTTEKDSIQNAINLLDSAIVVNSKDSKALLLKQSYQTWLGEYENALKTIKILETLKPYDPELKSKEGLLYLLKGNNKSAKIALMQSDSLWNIRLDTISQNSDWGLLGILMGKAANLKLLGKEKQANNVYRRILKDSIFDKTEYKGMKKIIDSLFLNQTKEEFYNYLVRGLKNNESPNR